ncbi:MAG: orotidine 5'-phosphate decarboxylase / HUMPS family protein [Pirellulales bacterium]
MPVPLVQLALDFPTVEQALQAAEIGVRAGVDILEAGTPLIVAQGVTAIGRLAKAFPHMPVLADYKTMDSGFRNVQLTKEQGGHYMTVCANSPDETVQSAIRQGKESSIQVVADTIGVKNQAARSRQCAEWGVDMIYLHFGADQRRAAPDRDTVPWIEEVQAAVDIPIGVATFDVADGVAAARKGVYLLAIGHPVVGTDEAAFDRLRRYVEAVKSV